MVVVVVVVLVVVVVVVAGGRAVVGLVTTAGCWNLAGLGLDLRELSGQVSLPARLRSCTM